jgi:subtilisin family serine protease
MNGAIIPGQVLVRLRPGVALSHTPSHRDVQDGERIHAAHLDHGPADAAIRRYSPAQRVSRIHQAAGALGVPGFRHQGWSRLEQLLGMPRMMRIDVSNAVSLPHLLEDLRACETVESAAPNRLCRLKVVAEQPRLGSAVSDPFVRIGHARARALEPGDPTLIIGIIDSGVRLDHPEFIGRLRAGLDLVEVIEGAPDGMTLVGDIRDRDRIPEDEQGHGTACAGLIGARGLGVPPGLAGFSQLLPIRVLAAAREIGSPPNVVTEAIGSLADIDAGFKSAIDLGARVLNLSFGTPASALLPGEPVPHAELVRYALARNCLLIAAAGNSGIDERYFPACLPGVIAVGAVDAHDHPATFSTRGGHVAICAPGTAIPVVGIDGYQRMSGTSFAAPLVTAACALLMARAARQSCWLPVSSVRTALCQTARAFPQPTSGCGSGILDVPAALLAVDDLLADPLRSNPTDEVVSELSPEMEESHAPALTR